jgi:hypothetical protein
LEHNKAPGPDAFPTEFYQHFWEIINLTFWRYLMSFIKELYLCTISILAQLLCCLKTKGDHDSTL